MTRQELASSTFDRLQEQLALEGILKADVPPDLREDLLDMIERGIDEAGQSPTPTSTDCAPLRADDKDEARLALTDTARLNVNKPVGERITVDSSAFSLADGHVVIQSGEELAVRERNGQLFITKRRA